MMPRNPPDDGEYIIQLDSTKPDVMTVRKVTTLSGPTLRRRYGKYIISLSERRDGMKMKIARKIASGEIKPAGRKSKSARLKPASVAADTA